MIGRKKLLVRPPYLKASARDYNYYKHNNRERPILGRFFATLHGVRERERERETILLLEERDATISGIFSPLKRYRLAGS